MRNGMRHRSHACWNLRALAGAILLTLLFACSGGGNDFPEGGDPQPPPADPQTGTTTPDSQPPTPLPPTPPPTPGTGPDTEAPRVEMVLPAQNDTLTGVAAIVAAASDNVGVASVQFLADNKPIGAPDTAGPYWLQFDTSYLPDGTHVFSARAFDGADNRTTAAGRTVSVSNGCKTASPALTPWQNTAFTALGSSFTVQWDVTPLESNLDAAVGLSRGDANGFTDLATLVRFNTSNTIDARNGNTFAAANRITYQPNQTFRIRLEVNLASRTYSVFVTPEGGFEQTLGVDFAFRIEQQGVTSLNRWVVGSRQGALKACNFVTSGNSPPVASAGPDQTVTAGVRVVLDGSASTDPDGTIGTYEWRRIAGPAVTLTAGNTPTPTFTAPQVFFDTVIEFQLTVTDNRGATASDTVRITVQRAAPANISPTANAGADQSVIEGAVVTLSGSGIDPDGSIVSFAWTQTGGSPAVTLTGASTPIATFLAPLVPADTVLTFQFTVTDNDGASATDTVNVTVRSSTPVNSPPTADAGLDQSVVEGSIVTLSGSGTDADGAIVGFAWEQIPATTVNLVGASTASPSFTAPPVAGPVTLTFQLTVTDNGGATGSDTVNVTVTNAAADTAPPPAP